MPETRTRPLWRGRVLAVLGILLVAANLRAAVTALSPIFAEIRVDVPIDSIGVGVLGMLPPVCFAVFGIFAPFFTRRASLEFVMVIALCAVFAGHLLRASSTSFLALAAGSVVIFAGMGVGNVLLPPLVKRYFPDRIGLMTSLYATVLSVSTLLPPLIAVPVADSAGWRISVGVWAVLGLFAAVPWIGILLRRKPAHPDNDVAIEEPEPQLLGRVWHTVIGWSLAIVFAVSSLNAYAMFAWLPEILTDTAKVDAGQAGLLLSIYSGMGIPAGLLIPVLATRMKNVALLVYLGVALSIVGYLGLIFAPATGTWVWVIAAGLGTLLFPICLVLINLRTRTHAGAVALSGFAQGFGYTLGALGPLAVGFFHQITGQWTIALFILTGTVIVAAIAGFFLARPRQLEDSFRR